MVTGSQKSEVRSQKDGNKIFLKFIFLPFVFCLILLACSTVEERNEASEPNKGQFTLFLNGPDKVSVDVSFNLSAVNIVSEDGASKEVMNTPLSINSLNMTGRQVLLGEKSLPEGRYKKLKFVIKDATVKRKERASTLSLPAEAVEAEINIDIKRQQNTSLFINWNADASIRDGYSFNPAFNIKGQSPELSTSLIYVTNEDSNNVSVINRQSGNVVATVMVGKKPRGVAALIGRERLKVYVANSGSNSISVIDPTTNRVEGEAPIRFGSEPEGLAAASLPSGKELIFVTNYKTNSVSVVDTSTLQEIEKIDVGRGPIAAAADPAIETLTGSRFLSFEEVNIIKGFREKFLNVYVVNQNSNTVSVIMIDVLTGRAGEVVNLNVEWRPRALAVDYQRGKVYVANYNSDKLSVIDILQVIKGNLAGAVSTINNVGTSITGVVAEPAFDRIYLLKELSGEVTIIKPVTETAADPLKPVMPPIMGTIAVEDSPRSFILDPELRKLYVVNRGSNNISVIDKTTKRPERVIPVGMKPYGIAMFPK
ncbi:MAG: DUF4382 domain-containing protein [Nitrospirae bacterium]|nr:DUF4382 domain-containing protein [Nitrospirota bacterium]